MKIAVTGVTGQVGWELVRCLQPFGKVVPLDRQNFDLGRPETLAATLKHIRPDVIFNPAAYTAVDRAESEAELAVRINAESVGVIAAEARSLGALLVHYSTDYVFSGEGDQPYRPTDPVGPRSVYGSSKLAGEEAVRASGADWLCLRTSWVYASRGKNFVRTMLRLACDREELRVVADQVGAPTWCRLIADASVLAMISALHERREGRFVSEMLHLSAAGAVTWHGFAEAIIDGARHRGMLGLRASRVVPIATSEYPTPARRPANSRLDCRDFERRFQTVLPAWEAGLSLCLDELQAREWK